MRFSASSAVMAIICVTIPTHHRISVSATLGIRKVVMRKEVNLPTYGVDVSFPMHHGQVSTNYAWLPHNIDPDHNPVPEEYKDMPVQPLGNRQDFYDDFLQGCRNYFKDKAAICEENEKERVETSLQRVMVMKNFTDTGFQTLRVPRKVFNRINKFWEKNKHDAKQEEGDSFSNFWDSPTYMLSFEDESLRQEIWNSTRDILQQWMGLELRPIAIEGIRVFKEGAVQTHHVDELPRVGSAIINVAQDIDEKWPIEVIGHDGYARNVTMHPGDMIMYESHSTIHGRPFPLKGRYYASIVVHFEPTGRSLYGKSLSRDGDDNGVEIPPYIAGGSWMVDEDGRWKLVNEDYKVYDTQVSGSNKAHFAAHMGDLKTLLEIASKDPEQLHERDENGWMPIHEAAREGHKDVIELLLNYGADINQGTHYESNHGTPLYWALSTHGEDHPVVAYLRSLGAVSVGPESEL